MTALRHIAGGLLLAALPVAAQAATEIGLSSVEEVAAAFPSTHLPTTGSELGFDASTRLRLHAARVSDDSGNAEANVYSAQSYSGTLNFHNKPEGVTITFNDVRLDHSADGSYHNCSLGIANNNTGSFSASAVSRKVYFYIERNTKTITLRRRSTGDAVTLGTWTLGTAWPGTTVSLPTVSLTLTATTWSATVGNETKSGDLGSSDFSQASWGDKYYIGLQTSTASTSNNRTATGYIGSIDIGSKISLATQSGVPGGVTTAFPFTHCPSTASERSFDSTRHLRLHAARVSGDSVNAEANAYSAQSYSGALDFFKEGGTTITFNKVSLMRSNVGIYQNFSLGIANNNSVSFSGSLVGQKVYFYIARKNGGENDGDCIISLRRRSGVDPAHELASWTLPSSAWVDDGGSSSVSLDSISLTLTPTTWRATIKKSPTVNETHSGVLKTPLTAGNWGGKYHIGLQTATASNANDCTATGYIGSIDIGLKIGLSSPSEIATVFPSTYFPSTGSDCGLDENPKQITDLRLRAARVSGDSGNAEANAYSAQSYSDALDFFSGYGTTITFKDVGLTHNATGEGYYFMLGIANGNSGSFSGSAVGEKVYFQISRYGHEVSLRKRSGIGTAHVLHTWPLGAGAWSNDGQNEFSTVSFHSLSLTLTSTSWMATVERVKGTMMTGQGILKTAANVAIPLVRADWNDDLNGAKKYFIGLQTSTGSTNTERIADGSVGSIEISSKFEIVPESVVPSATLPLVSGTEAQELANHMAATWRSNISERNVRLGVGRDGYQRFLAEQATGTDWAEWRTAAINRVTTLLNSPIPDYLDPADSSLPPLQAQEEAWLRPLGDELVLLSMVGALPNQFSIAAQARTRLHALVLALCGYDTWGRNAALGLTNQDLAAAHVVRGIAFAWAWHGNSGLWNSTQRNTILTTIRARAGTLAGLITTDAIYWTRAYNDNHNQVINAAVGWAGAAFLNEEAVPEAPVWFARALLNYRNVARYYPADGGSAEGVPYWSYGVSFILQYLEGVRDIVDTSKFYEGDWLRNMAGYRLHSSTSGFNGVLPWGDSDAKDFYGPHHILLRLASEYGSKDAAYLAKRIPYAPQGNADITAWAWLWFDPGVNRDTAPKALDHHSTAVDIVNTRSGWTAGDYMLSLGSGYTNANHSHLDVGAIVLAFGDKWLITTPGYGQRSDEAAFWQRKGPRWTYTSNATESHSTLLIDGANQLFTREARGTVSTFFSSLSSLWAEVDLVGAYGVNGVDWDNPPGNPAWSANSVWRRLLHRRGEYFLVFDDWELTSARQVQWLLSVPASGSGIQQPSGVLTVANGGNSIDVKPLLPAPSYRPNSAFAYRDSWLSPNPNVNASWMKSAFATSPLAQNGSFRVFIQPRPAGSSVTLDTDTTATAPTFVGNSKEIRLVKRSGAGGWQDKITLDRSPAAPVRLLVQRSVSGEVSELLAVAVRQLGSGELTGVTPILSVSSGDAGLSFVVTKVSSTEWKLESDASLSTLRGRLVLSTAGSGWQLEERPESEGGGYKIVPAPLSALQGWRTLHFGSPADDGEAASAADPDGDGLPNLLEYALGGNPRAADSAACSPVLALGAGAEPRLTLAFTVTDDPALRYAVEASVDLFAWSPIWPKAGDIPAAGRVVVEDVAPLADFTSRFLRLCVSAVL